MKELIIPKYVVYVLQWSTYRIEIQQFPEKVIWLKITQQQPFRIIVDCFFSDTPLKAMSDINFESRVLTHGACRRIVRLFAQHCRKGMSHGS